MPDDFSPAELAPLLTPDGIQLLDSLGEYREEFALRRMSQLRAEGFDARVIAAAMTQARLRTSAVGKFGEFAQHMLFTQTGLEQATRLTVAAVHAGRFLDGGHRHVADLGCGIGADSIALASAGLQVTAVEQDETTAAVATFNLTPFDNARVLQADVRSLDLDALPGGRPDALWLDPARRTASGAARRIFDPEAFSPPLSFVEGLADSGVPLGVKLGPGIPHESVPGTCEAQWISHHGDVVEVALWFNALARPGVRRAALVIGAHGHAELVSGEPFPDPAADDGSPAGSADPAPGDTDGEADAPLEAGHLLWEPDGAVIRAGLVRDLADRLGARPVHPRIAYLTAPDAQDPITPFARAFRVREVLPQSVKTLKAWVRENQVGTLEIKKRGTDVTPEQLRRQLRPSGPHSATLVLTRLGHPSGDGPRGERRVALVVEPLG